ncbi:MAG: transcriptional repressor [Chloroflexota bacterium]
MMQEYKDSLNLWVEELNQQKLGNSEIQEAFITVLSTAMMPMKAEEIREAVQQLRPETGRATVYRFIDKLTSVGLLRRVHGYQNCSTYMPVTNVYQPLLLCTDCGQVSYLNSQLCMSINQAVESVKQVLEDHQVTGYQLQFFEVCSSCQTDEP